MNFIIRLNYFILLTGIILNVTSHNFADTSKLSEEQNRHQNFLILSTVDGSVTALDLNTGHQIWSVLLDSQKFLSSSLSKLEVYESGKRIFLVPSLDGNVYKYDTVKKIITPLPVNVDTLINQAGYLDPSNVVNGGKIKIIHGIHRLTGEVIYTCNGNGCINFKTVFPENMLVIEEIIQYVNAIDSNKAERRWHFRVVELNVRVASYENSSSFANGSKETALIPQIPPNMNDFLNLDVYKISLESGFAGKINETQNEFSWIFKTSSPINDAWVIVDDQISLLDPFDKESSFYSVDMDDGKHSALLFLGTYEEEKFVKRSRKFKQRQYDVTTHAQNFFPPTAPIPVCLTENTISGPYSQSGGTDLIPHHDHFAVSDYGLYFYANLSVSENATHCILNITNTFIWTHENELPWSIWITVFLFCALLTTWVWISLIKPSKEEKSFANKSTNSISVIVKEESNEKYSSRFYDDFVPISILGKGGFGIVMDAKNKIDECHYAVKRIHILKKEDDPEAQKVLREVKALAKLEHHGIVRYFHAWFEYPPAGWVEKMDKESNIRCISVTSSDEEGEIPSEKQLKIKDHSLQNSPQLKSINPAVLKTLNQNPLKLSNNDIFSNNVPFGESTFSDYSSTDGNDKSSTSSEENCDLDLFENHVQDSSKCSNDESDSFIQFENVDLNYSIPGRDQLIKKCSNDETESSVKSNSKNKCSSKFFHTKNNVISAQEYSLPFEISKKHVQCYKSLKMLNEQLIYPLSVEMVHTFSSFIFCGNTLTESIVDTSSWNSVANLFTKKELDSHQNWLICILCHIKLSKKLICSIAEENCYNILSDISDRLHRKEFTRETCSVQHSNVSSVELPKRHSYLYIQMQLCKKESLRDWLNQHSDSRDYNKVLEIFSQIVDAVHYVHSCGMMHRDLKPSNIYFSLEGAIKIGDFGLATSSEINVEKDSCRKPSDMHTSDIGTELYMSPEQKLKEDYDCKTDIYSLGIIFFELLVPFKTALERCKVLSQVRAYEFPKEFERNFQSESQFVKLLLDADPKERPTTGDIMEHPVLAKFTVQK